MTSVISKLSNFISGTRSGALLMAALVAFAITALPIYFSLENSTRRQQYLIDEAERHLNSRVLHAQALLERAKAFPAIVALSIAHADNRLVFEETIRNLLAMSGIVDSVNIVSIFGPATIIHRDPADQTTPINIHFRPTSRLTTDTKPFIGFGDGSLLIKERLSETDSKGNSHTWGYVTAEASFAYFIQELQLLPLVNDGFGVTLNVRWRDGAAKTVLFTGGDQSIPGTTRSLPLPGNAMLSLSIMPPEVPLAGLSNFAWGSLLAFNFVLFAFIYHLIRRPQLLEIEVKARTSEIVAEKLALNVEINAREQAEHRVSHLNRVLMVLTDINHLIIHARDREYLLVEAHRILQEKGGFPAVWIHVTDNNQSTFIAEPAIQHYAARICAEIDNPKRNCWPKRRLHCKALDCCNLNLASELDELGLQSLIHLPLKSSTSVWGDIGILGPAGQTFSEEEQSLLEELAGNLSFALDAIHQEERRLAAEKNLALSARVFESNSEGIFITDQDNRILMVNKAFTTLTGYTPEEVMGNTPSILNSERHDVEFFDEMRRTLEESDEWHGEVINRRKNGEAFPEWLNISVVRNESGQISNYVAVFTDLTSRRQIEARVDFLAHYDSLTALPNRDKFVSRLTEVIDQARNKGTRVGVIYLDLDRFKLINETIGHTAADQVLLEISGRLIEVTKSKLNVARLSGDHFALLIPELESLECADDYIRLIQNKLGLPFLHFLKQEIHISASIGISIFPEDGIDTETLICNADSAMYAAITDGGNTYRFFRREMNSDADARVLLESKLHHALERGEFAVHFQPFISTASGRIAGAEALLRWNCPELGGDISPVTFIPLLEEIGLIKPVGEWVLNQACTQLKRWQLAGNRKLFVAVNISAHQLLDDLPSLVAKALTEHRIEPAQLEIELTESAIMRDADHGIRILHELKALNVQLSIDDFGTGYSSLSYLKRLPMSTLKIDRSFVTDIPDDAEAVSIARAILALGSALHLHIIAEGVETQEQVNFLCQNGCNLLQGYFFSKPLPAPDFLRLLEKTKTFQLPLSKPPLQLVTSNQYNSA